MNLQELQQEVLDTSLVLHNAKISFSIAKEMALASYKKYNIASSKYEIALNEQEKFAYQRVVFGCPTLACFASSVVKLR